jgi:hypothetical protein
MSYADYGATCGKRDRLRTAVRHMVAMLLATAWLAGGIWYHLVPIRDGGPLFSFDQAITTGFKAFHAVWEIFVLAMPVAFSIRLADWLVTRKARPDASFCYPKLVLGYSCACVIALQLGHIWLDHDGRWPLCQDWTHPQPAGIGLLSLPVILLSTGLLAMIGSTIGMTGATLLTELFSAPVDKESTSDQ